MPKTVDNYIIQKQLFKDCFQIKTSSILVEYFSCKHKILKKPFTIKKIEKAIEKSGTKQQENHNLKLLFAYSCIQNESKHFFQSMQFKSLVSQIRKSNQMPQNSQIKNAVYAVYDQHPEGSLEKIINTEYLTSQKKQTILNQTLGLIRELHDQNVVIGNLSPSNLFFTQDFKILISNFFIAKILEDSEQAQIDPFLLDKKSQYYAPELLKNGTITKNADIFSFGQIIRNLKFQRQTMTFYRPLKTPKLPKILFKKCLIQIHKIALQLLNSKNSTDQTKAEINPLVEAVGQDRMKKNG